MIEVKGIDVSYGDVQVLHDVSFTVGQGEVVALIGANGAGKSTSLKTISGLLRPSKGDITYEGRSICDVAPHNLIELGIVHVPEGRRLFSGMSVEENLIMGSLKGDAKAKRMTTLEEVYDIFPRLRERSKQHAGTLSGGEQQMVAIARGLMSKPRLMMFDEPSLGLAPILVSEIFKVIERITSEGATVLIVEQNVKQTLRIAERAYVLENGRVVLEGTGQELSDNEHVRNAYLGV
jgi:branched-chain amino acid transport system ATP-binding protein